MGNLSRLNLCSRPSLLQIDKELLGLSFVRAQLVIFPSAHNCLGECIALEDDQQKNKFTHLVMMDLRIVSNMKL